MTTCDPEKDGALAIERNAGERLEERRSAVLQLFTRQQPVYDQTEVIISGTGKGFGTSDLSSGGGMLKKTDRGESRAQLTATDDPCDIYRRSIDRVLASLDDPVLVVQATNIGILERVMQVPHFPD